MKQYVEEVVHRTPPVVTADGSAAAGSTDSDKDDLLPFMTAFEGQLKQLAQLRAQVDERLAILDAEDGEDAVHSAQQQLSVSFTVQHNGV